ncbi:MAG: CoA-binding protein [Candidatus Neomarinimicrobiota bacterium]
MSSIETINKIFTMRSIAVVGMSPKPQRPSHYVALYLKENGYNIIPVNPGHSEIAGMKSYSNLLEIPSKVDIVDVFRRSEHVVPIVKEAIKINAKAIWLQDGIINEEAAQVATSKNLLFVMNDCMLRRHHQL